MIILFVLFMIAIPSFEQNRKSDIVNFFGQCLQFIEPLSRQGLPGLLYFCGLVAVWDGISVLPVRYIEFMVALCYQTAPEYITIIVIGKTLGGIFTYKACHAFLQCHDLQDLFLSNGLSLYANAISDLVREQPFLYGLTFRTFFPSVLNCIALAMLPLSLSQFVVIQFLHAVILAWP